MFPPSEGRGLYLSRENFIKPEFTKRKLFLHLWRALSFQCFDWSGLFCFFILFHLSLCHLGITQTLQGPVPPFCFQRWCVLSVSPSNRSGLCKWNLTSIRRYLLYIRETAVCCTELISAEYLHFKASGRRSCSLPRLTPSITDSLLPVGQWVRSKRKSIGAGSEVELCFLTLKPLDFKVIKIDKLA